MTSLRISQLAKRSGVPATTLRFYETAGLLPADRTAAGYRIYGEDAVERLAFIGAAKHLGLPLEEIAELLAVWECSNPTTGPSGPRKKVGMTDRMALMGIRERWDQTYQILLPQALRPVDETRREFTEAVFHAWLMWHRDTPEDELDTLITDDEILALRALEESCSLGWRNALLGRTLTDHEYEEVGRPYGGPHRLWGAPVRTTADKDFRPPNLPEPMGPGGHELPVRRSLRDALSSVKNQFAHVVHTIRDVHTSITAVPVEDRPPIDCMREVVTRLCLGAWHEEVEVNDRRGWDDAEWWQYLNLEDLLPWMAVALGLPGEHPERYGDLVEPVAFRTVTDPLKAWGWKAIPSNFVSELGDACVGLALAETKRSKGTEPAQAPAETPGAI